MSYLNKTELKEVNDTFNALEEVYNILKDPNLNKVFFKKFRVIKKIADGSFGSIYEGINTINNKPIAIKLEDRSKYNLLEKEAYNLYTLKGFGIVEILSFGKNFKYNIMIQSLLGDSLYKIFLDCKKKFELKDICLIGLQCLDRIEWIHTRNIIHRDIKPENFLTGLKDPRIIYMIDFGLCKKYRSERTMKHIQFSLTKKLTGTARYASINALKGFELSRRDDLESFCYMIIFFILKKLPWQGIKAESQARRYQKICILKENFKIEEYKKLPLEIIEIFKYVKKLKFDEEPNYDKLRNLFKYCLDKTSYNKNDTFSWIKDKKIIVLKKSSDIHRRKSNYKKRILDNLIKNEKINKSIDIINDKSNNILISYDNNSNNINNINNLNTINNINNNNISISTMLNYDKNYQKLKFNSNDFIHINTRREAMTNHHNDLTCSSRKAYLEYNIEGTKSMEIHDENQKRQLSPNKKENENRQSTDKKVNMIYSDNKRYKFYRLNKLNKNTLNYIKTDNNKKTIKRIKINQIKNIQTHNINNFKNIKKENLLNIINNETMDTSKILSNIKLYEYSPKYPMNKSYINTNNNMIMSNNNKIFFNMPYSKNHYIQNQIRKKTNIKYNNMKINTRYYNNLLYGSIFNSYKNL